eukprot:gene4472-6323_t
MSIVDIVEDQEQDFDIDFSNFNIELVNPLNCDDILRGSHNHLDINNDRSFILSEGRECFCMDEKMGTNLFDIILPCDCLIHYSCLIQYIFMQLGDKMTLMNHLPSEDPDLSSIILCPFIFSNQCTFSNTVKDRLQNQLSILPGKYFLSFSDMLWLVKLGPAVISVNEYDPILQLSDVSKVKRWIQQRSSAIKYGVVVSDIKSNGYIEATTKPCPKCKVRGTHFHGHACHHISPSGGCPNCKTHYCFKCLSTEEQNLSTRGNRATCLCGYWSSFCAPISNADDAKQYIDKSPYPHDRRCGCAICPECRPSKPCESCPGDCVVCLRILPPGPQQLSIASQNMYTWQKFNDAVPIYKRFTDACKFLKVEELQSLIDENDGQLFSVPDNLGRTPLHYCCDGPSTLARNKIIKIIIDFLPETVMAWDYSGNSPIHLVCQHGNFIGLQQLVEAGAYVNCANNEGATPLIESATSGDINIISYLLSKGADVSLQSSYSTALLRAARFGHATVVKLLHEAGASISVKNKEGYTPLLIATTFGQNEVVKYLLPLTSDLAITNQYGRTILYEAVSADYTSLVVDVLIPLIDVNHVNMKDRTYGETALIKATRLNNEIVVKVLLEKGADVLIKDNSGQTALNHARKPEIKAILKKIAKLQLSSKTEISVNNNDKKSSKKINRSNNNYLVEENDKNLNRYISTISTINEQQDIYNNNNNSTHFEVFKIEGEDNNDIKYVIPLCSNDSNAVQQQEEVEALGYIYPGDINILRVGPTKEGEPTASFIIVLSTESNVTLKLHFDMPSDYPEMSPPNIDIISDNLSLLEFSFAMREALINDMNEVAQASIGSVSVLACIQEAINWMAEEYHVFLSFQNNGGDHNHYKYNKSKVSHSSAYYYNQLAESTDEFGHALVGKNVGKIISQARLSRGMTQASLAMALNVRTQVIQQYESGQAIPNSTILTKIKKALDISKI